MNPDSRPTRRRCHRHLGTGIFLILLGLMLAFENWHGTPFFELGRHWPLILIAFGAGRMVDRGLFAWGPHAMILVGLYFELDRLGHYDWIHRAWPLGFVWLGLILTLRGLRPRAESPSECIHD